MMRNQPRFLFPFSFWLDCQLASCGEIPGGRIERRGGRDGDFVLLGGDVVIE